MLIEHLNTLFTCLASHPQLHTRGSTFYNFFEDLAKHAFLDAKPAFEAGNTLQIAELGGIILPYEKMGAIDSLDLFGLDELLMFSFYYRNRGRYARAVDIGANLGLHTIVMSLCGIKVDAYEPDPAHYEKLVRNLKLNNISNCDTNQKAVSDKDGTMQFVRVLGNTTSSHLAGAKAKPYGDLERFDVIVRNIRSIAEQVDLFKIDAEGHEAVLLKALPISMWGKIDAFVEIGTQENANAVFEHFSNSNVNIFSQKLGWGRVNSIENLPFSYREGGIFISTKSTMPW
jgi:FkbM family methyltransferase